jgi:hypothetical protein
MAEQKNLGSELEKQPKQVLEPERELKKDTKNKLIAVISYLSKRYEFRYNIIAAKVEYRRVVTEGPEEKFRFMDERAFDSMFIKIKIDGGLQVGLDDLRALLRSEDLSYEYNPFMEYLSALQPWDQRTDHIAEYLDQVILPDESTRARLVQYFKKWFVGLVACLVQDEIKNDTCFIFVGDQGKRKTTFLNNLVPLHLRLHYLYNGNYQFEGNKDHEEMLGTKILINLDELGNFNRGDNEPMKSRITQTQVNLRRAYGHEAIHLWRRASFCGSINRKQFLTDPTGNRRFLPFTIANIIINDDLDIGRLYAQALKLHKDGFQIFFNQEEIIEQEKYNDQFRDVPLEEELILYHFRKPTDEEIKNNKCEYLPTGLIAMRIAERYNKINVNQSYKSKLGHTLERLGFELVSKRVNGSPAKAWIVVYKVNGIAFDDMPPIPEPEKTGELVF